MQDLKVTLTLKTGRIIRGIIVFENKRFYKIDTVGGSTETVSKLEVEYAEFEGVNALNRIFRGC